MEKSNSQSMKAGVVILLLGLLGANVYQFINNRSLNADNKQKVSEMIELENAKKELDKQYFEAVANLNDLKTNNQELNNKIDTQKEELRLQKDRIDRLLVDSKNLAKAKQEINTLKTSAEAQAAEIKKLKEQVDQLSAANVDLTNQNQGLNSELEKSSLENQKLAGSNQSLSSEKENLAKERAELSKRVNKASAIVVQDLKAKGYRHKGTKLDDRSKAADVELIQVCFETTKNEHADNGSQRFYLRIIDPLGQTQAVDALGSGVLTNEKTGDQVRYSSYADVPYNQDERTACINWEPGNTFTKGTYQIEVYNKGHLVGTSSLKLK